MRKPNQTASKRCSHCGRSQRNPEHVRPTVCLWCEKPIRKAATAVRGDD